MNKQELVDQLFEAATNSGWSRYDIAKEIGVSVDTVLNWRKGKTLPQRVNMRVIQNFVEGKDATHLLREDDIQAKRVFELERARLEDNKRKRKFFETRFVSSVTNNTSQLIIVSSQRKPSKTSIRMMEKMAESLGYIVKLQGVYFINKV